MLIVLDRDGVINQDSSHFIKSPEEFIFLPGSLEAIAALTKAHYKIGIASNQSGIARGLLSEEALQHIHHHMLNTIHQYGGDILDIAYCPHLPDAGCACRKPAPGLLIQLAKQAEVPVTDIIFVGDRVSDIKAAEAIGAQPIWVRSTLSCPLTSANYPHIPAFDSLLEFVDNFLCTHKI